MIWDDKGYLLSKNKYSENSIISEVFTKDHGKVSGIIFGGTSKKIKNYLQIGNKIHVNFNSKNDNKLGYFKVEIQQALSPLYFDNQKKLSCITSAMNLIKILTAENQKNTRAADGGALGRFPAQLLVLEPVLLELQRVLHRVARNDPATTGCWSS